MCATRLPFSCLLTGDNQVMLMSRNFEVVYEAPLRTEEFGEGTYTRVNRSFLPFTASASHSAKI
jgi:hypothetical protein